MDRMSMLWWRWLLAAAMLVLLFGLSMLILPLQTQTFFNLLIFGTLSPPPDFSADAVSYIAFITGVLGAVMVGWSVLMLYILSGPFRRAEPGSWDMLAASLLAWFVPDTAFSLSTGYWQNAALNALFALIFAVPLAATWRRFHPRTGPATLTRDGRDGPA